jgi:hypothetical protein
MPILNVIIVMRVPIFNLTFIQVCITEELVKVGFYVLDFCKVVKT